MPAFSIRMMFLHFVLALLGTVVLLAAGQSVLYTMDKRSMEEKTNVQIP